MFNQTLSAQTLAQVNKVTGGDAFKAGITTGLGLNAYNLEPMAKLLVPEFFPLVKEIPRVTPPGNLAGLQPNWKQLTSFNSANIKPYVTEGNRGSLLSYTEANKSAAYVTHGLENNATFEADSASAGFEDVNALATLGLLNEFCAQEERQIIGGNVGLSLGQTATPVLTLEATGGSLISGDTYYVAVVALTFDGWDLANTSGKVQQTISQPNAGPYGGSTVFNAGSGIISAQGSLATSSTSQSIVATTAAITGAIGYAWYVGIGNTALYYQGVTTINSLNITNPVGTGQLFSALTAAQDNSSNSLAYDGILSQTQQGGYVYTMPTGTVGVGGAGTGLTPAGTGQGIGIVEFDNLLAYMWNTYKSSIGEILCSSQELNQITNKLLSAGSAPLMRFNYDGKNAGSVMGGTMVGEYLNKYAFGGPQIIPIKLHPYVPYGTIIFRPTKVPYQISNVGTILRMNCRKDYYELQWPLVTRAREWGIYNETVLQNYAPFMFGIITNIANK